LIICWRELFVWSIIVFFFSGKSSLGHLVAVVLDKETLLGALVTGITRVLALGGLAIGLAPLEQGGLGGGDVGLVTLPDLEDGGLEGTAVREGEGPGPEGGDLVDGVEVDGGLLLALTAGEEGDTGDGGGDSPLEGGDGGLGDIVGGVLGLALGAGGHHVGLEEGALEVEAVELAPSVGGGQDTLGGGNGGGELVVTVHEDLGLDNGHEAVHLGDDSHAGEGLGVGLDGELGGLALANAQGAAPLGEAGTSLEVISTLLVEVVQSLSDSLAIGTGEGNKTLQQHQEEEHQAGDGIERDAVVVVVPWFPRKP